MRPASAGDLGESIREIAKGDTAHDRDQAEGRDGDAGTRVELVKQEHQPCDYGRGNGA